MCYVLFYFIVNKDRRALQVQGSLYNTPHYNVDLDITRACCRSQFFFLILQRNCRKMTINWSFFYHFFVKLSLYNMILLKRYKGTTIPGHVVQLVTCLATDACLTADPGVASLIPARSHTFMEIDHEIISTVILLHSTYSFKKGCCQL